MGHHRSGRRHRRFRGFVLGFILLFFACAARAGDQFQFWASGTVAANLAERWKATINAQSRFDDRGALIRHHSDLGIVYTGVADWLDVGMNYRLVFRKLTEEDWKHENRPHLNFTMRYRLFSIAFNDRVRLEYNSLEDLTDFGTIRNRIAINPPFELEPDKERLILRDYTVKPYGSYEFFFDTLDNSITRQRFQAGLSIAFTERVIGDLFYMRQDSRSSIDDTDLNIAGLNLKLLF